MHDPMMAPAKHADAKKAGDAPKPSAPSSRRLRARLRRLARDCWWTWNEQAQRPFAALDPERWEWSRHSPLSVLRAIDDAALRARAAEPEFMELVDAAERSRREALDRACWFESTHPTPKLSIAYFCSEFALHESMPQYAGGLGILAGDHVKGASDLGVPLVGVGLLYHEGYYHQEIRADGTTRVAVPPIDLAELPLRRTGVEIDCPLGRRTVRLRVWRVRVGRTRLYLLDSDLRANRPRDRALTHGLYRGKP
ncbi:MAG: glycosyltransferase family 1 protein, partial [Phycisphaerae bacterium]|nr:glycosyltransferase family 1 protein [Phycisphaerae bacterium]